MYLLAVPASASAGEYVGTADKVADGDTFWLCNKEACQKIRLCGVNAPERGQAGYRESTEALSALVEGRNVRCRQVGSGTPCDGRSKPVNGDRIVAQCFAESDLANVLVSQGLACDWVRFSGGHYSREGRGEVCR